MKNLSIKILHISTLVIFLQCLFISCGKNQDGPVTGKAGSESRENSNNSTEIVPGTGCAQFSESDSLENVAVKAHKARIECDMSEEDIALKLKG